MDFSAYKNEVLVDNIRVLSIGGGDIHIVGEMSNPLPDIYPHSTFTDIKEYCKKKNITLFDYIKEVEPKETFDYIAFVWEQMKECIEIGLKTTVLFPALYSFSEKQDICFLRNTLMKHVKQKKTA